jgi:hypothetical protein
VLSRRVEVVRRGAFGADEDGNDRGAEAQRAGRLLFLMAGDGLWLRRRPRGCDIFASEKGLEEAENCQIASSESNSRLMTECGGNVPDKDALEITASSVSKERYAPRNATGLGDEDSSFQSENEAG